MASPFNVGTHKMNWLLAVGVVVVAVTVALFVLLDRGEASSRSMFVSCDTNLNIFARRLEQADVCVPQPRACLRTLTNLAQPCSDLDVTECAQWKAQEGGGVFLCEQSGNGCAKTDTECAQNNPRCVRPCKGHGDNFGAGQTLHEDGSGTLEATSCTPDFPICKQYSKEHGGDNKFYCMSHSESYCVRPEGPEDVCPSFGNGASVAHRACVYKNDCLRFAEQAEADVNLTWVCPSAVVPSDKGCQASATHSSDAACDRIECSTRLTEATCHAEQDSCCTWKADVPPRYCQNALACTTHSQCGKGGACQDGTCRRLCTGASSCPQGGLCLAQAFSGCGTAYICKYKKNSAFSKPTQRWSTRIV